MPESEGLFRKCKWIHNNTDEELSKVTFKCKYNQDNKITATPVSYFEILRKQSFDILV